MTRSLDLSLHAWRGIGSDEEPDLFFWRWRLGFVTVTLCRVCVLAAYQDARAEAARLRREMLETLRMLERRPEAQHDTDGVDIHR